MSNVADTGNPHPHIALLLEQYARDLAQTTPSSDLDARIDVLVAAGPQTTRQFARRPPAARRPRLLPFAVAAGITALAIAIGVIIGVRLEQSRDLAAEIQRAARDSALVSADLTMWPTDSVSFKIPAEYSPQGTLVAVDPHTRNTGTRYWIDVVVSNDGTFRIERIVPAGTTQKEGQDGTAPQVQ